MINNFDSIELTLTAAEYLVVAKEINSSSYVFGFDHEKTEDGKIAVSICGDKDELATLSLPAPKAAAPDPEDEDEEEDESSLTLTDVKDILIGSAVGATKIGLKTAGGVVEVVGAAGGRAALAGSNTVIRTGKAVVGRITEDAEFAEAVGNVSTACDLGKTVASKAFSLLGKAGRAIKAAAK